MHADEQRFAATSAEEPVREVTEGEPLSRQLDERLPERVGGQADLPVLTRRMAGQQTGQEPDLPPERNFLPTKGIPPGQADAA